MGSSSDRWHEEQDFSSVCKYELDQLRIMVNKLIDLAKSEPEWAKERLEELMKAIYGGKVQITFVSHKEPNHEKQSNLCVTGDKQAPKSPLQEIWEIWDEPKTQ